MDLLVFFEWLDTSMLASIAKSSGGVFALVQTVHLASLTVLGGMILACDLRLMNLLLKDIPVNVVVENTTRWITYALVGVVLSGIYQSSAVAIKLYYNEFFWAKMAGLAFGVAFVYCVRVPLLAYDHETIRPWAIRAVAVTSLIVWFTVAASGRWIGFS